MSRRRSVADHAPLRAQEMVALRQPDARASTIVERVERFWRIRWIQRSIYGHPSALQIQPIMRSIHLNQILGTIGPAAATMLTAPEHSPAAQRLARRPERSPTLDTASTAASTERRPADTADDSSRRVSIQIAGGQPVVGAQSRRSSAQRRLPYRGLAQGPPSLGNHRSRHGPERASSGRQGHDARVRRFRVEVRDAARYSNGAQQRSRSHLAATPSGQYAETAVGERPPSSGI